ncbi:MAG: nucleotidyl transferase AbiEii/AbiGii toxin family protein [Polyangiaceae bacterium]|nr:nucleotidyl transferase AbiEii/AbiGii toxin family protein [Polyangiaceae bacterium]
MASSTEGRGRTLGDVAPLTPAQQRALAGLKRSGVLDWVYLAGGVAIAAHLRHRSSNDLDFFSLAADLDLEDVRRQVVRLPRASVVVQTEAALKVTVGGAMVDFVRYPYPPLGRFSSGPEGVRVAGLRDLAVMKLAAIARRGARRDYWDLHEILTRRRVSLRAAGDDYVTKFGVLEADLYHVLRALGWFEDAESEPSFPKGLTKGRWQAMRDWLAHQAAKELLRRTSETG